MTNLEFGVTLTVVGITGTMFILFLITLVIDALNKFFRTGEKGKGE